MSGPQAVFTCGVPRNVYHGSGREKQASIYTGPAVPVLGSGKYFALTENDARRYGPNVSSEPFPLVKPFVIGGDAEWRAVTKQAGWIFPNPIDVDAGEFRAMTER